MKATKTLQPLETENFGSLITPELNYLKKLEQSISLLNSCVAELSSSVSRIVQKQAQPISPLPIKFDVQYQSQNSKNSVLPQESISACGSPHEQEWGVEPRFRNVVVPLPERDESEDQGMPTQDLRNWVGRACKTIFSVGFRLLQTGELDINKVKVYCSQNFLRNLLALAQQHRLTASNFQTINQTLKLEILPYLLLKYPQTQEKDSSKRFSQILIERDTSAQNDYDLVHRSGIVFWYQPDGNYNSEIMRFINYVIRLPNTSVSNANVNLYQMFVKDSSSIFSLIQSEYSKISILKFDPLNPQNYPLTTGLQLTRILNQSLAPKPKDPAISLRQEQQEQSYKQKVKSYTASKVGSKLPHNFPLFSDYQIRDGNLTLSGTAIMRVVAKWCEELEKCFEEKTILGTKNPFRMKDGSQKFLTRMQMEIFNLMLQRERRIIQEQLTQIQKNSHQQQRAFSALPLSPQLQSFTAEESGVGQFVTGIYRANENYLINYLNLLIHGINSAANAYARFRDYETFCSSHQEATENIEAICKYGYDQSVLARIEQEIGVYALSWENRLSQTPELISFKIGDLLRCKCSSKQDEILALYKQVQKINFTNPKLLKIIRLKNRLNMGNKDILINLLYRETIIVEMQLAINSESSNFIKCSNTFNHYLSELKRAQFGPIVEMCSIWASLDLRATFFMNRLQSVRNSQARVVGNDSCCVKRQHTKFVRLPFTCNTCRCYYHHFSFSQQHIYCEKCQKFTCFLCQIETFPPETKTNLLPQLMDHESLNLEKAEFLRQIPKKGGAIINLKSKNQSLEGSEIYREDIQSKPYQSVLSEIDRPESSPKFDIVIQSNRKAALSIMSRVFKKNMTKQVKTWQHSALPEKKLEMINKQLPEKMKDDYDYVAKIGAVENLSKMNTQIIYKAKSKAFRMIIQHMFNKRIENDHEESLSDRLELLNRHNSLLEEFRNYEDENKFLHYELENKDNKIREANETVTILSLRINYMITQKFLNMIEKVWENIQYRHYNHAFDAFIEEANQKFERQEVGMFGDGLDDDI